MKFLILILFLSLAPSQARSEEASHSGPFTVYPFELRTSASLFTLLSQWYVLESAIRINDFIDMGLNYTRYNAHVDFESGNMYFPSQNGYSYGLNVNYYAQSLNYDSWYTSLKIKHDNYKSVRQTQSFIQRYDGASLTVLFGRRVVMPSLSERISILFAAGPEFDFYQQTTDAKDVLTQAISSSKIYTTPTHIAFELKLAWQF